MIEPDFDMDPASYVILGYGPNDSEFEQTIDETTVEITNLDFGEWEICVYARNQDGIVIADGCASSVVHAGTTTPVSIIVVPLDGTGILDLTVLWNEEDTEFPSIDSELMPANSATMPLNFTISQAV